MMEQSPQCCSSLQVLSAVPTFSPSRSTVQKPPAAPIRQQKTSHHGELNNSRLFFVAVIQLKKNKNAIIYPYEEFTAGLKHLINFSIDSFPLDFTAFVAFQALSGR